MVRSRALPQHRRHLLPPTPSSVRRLREESLRALQEALVLVSAPIAEAERLEPLGIEWSDCSRPELGDICCFLPSQLRRVNEKLVTNLENAWNERGVPWLEWRGIQAGFVNFAWSVSGYAKILSLGQGEEPPTDVWHNPLHLQQWSEARLDWGGSGQRLSPPVIMAYQRTLGLEKMGRNLLSPFSQLLDPCRLAEDESAWMRWADILTSATKSEAESAKTQPEMLNQRDFLPQRKGLIQREVLIQREMLARVERLIWAQILHPHLVSSQRADLARQWNSYYEQNRLLKGTDTQIEARLCLGRAVRFGLETYLLEAWVGSSDK